MILLECQHNNELVDLQLIATHVATLFQPSLLHQLLAIVHLYQILGDDVDNPNHAHYLMNQQKSNILVYQP